MQVIFAINSPIASLATTTGSIFLARHAFCLQKVMLNKLHPESSYSALVLVPFYLFLVDPCLKTVSRLVEVSSVVDLVCDVLFIDY